MLALFLPFLSSLPPTHRHQCFVLFILVYIPLCSFLSSLIAETQLHSWNKLKIALLVLSQTVSISAIPTTYYYSLLALWKCCYLPFHVRCIGLLDTSSFCWDRCQTCNPCLLLFFPVVTSFVPFSIFILFPAYVSFLSPLAVVQNQEYLHIPVWCAYCHLCRERKESTAYLLAYVSVFHYVPPSAWRKGYPPLALCEMKVPVAGDNKEWWEGLKKSQLPLFFLLFDIELHVNVRNLEKVPWPWCLQLVQKNLYKLNPLASCKACCLLWDVK